MAADLICVKHKGVSYCLELETGHVRTFTDLPMLIKDCPREVVDDLLKLLALRFVEKQ